MDNLLTGIHSFEQGSNSSSDPYLGFKTFQGTHTFVSYLTGDTLAFKGRLHSCVGSVLTVDTEKRRKFLVSLLPREKVIKMEEIYCMWNLVVYFCYHLII